MPRTCKKEAIPAETETVKPKQVRRKKTPEKAEAPAERKTKGTFIRRKVIFSVHAEPGSTVSVAGSFNNWNPDAKQLKDPNGTGDFTGFMFLLPGQYEYKFVVNGVWTIDTKNPSYVPNDMNSLNSVLNVK